MAEAYIIAAARTPIGRRNGSLSRMHPTDLAALVMRGTLERSGIEPGAVDDVIWGVLDPLGGQAHDVARLSWLAAGLPQHVPGVTIDRQCGSSQQAVHFAAQAVMSGAQDVVVAGGVQLMSVVPINLAWTVGSDLRFTNPFESEGWQKHYGSEEIDQFRAADLIAEKWKISREEMEEYGLTSHQRAIHAIDAGYFVDQ